MLILSSTVGIPDVARKSPETATETTHGREHGTTGRAQQMPGRLASHEGKVFSPAPIRKQRLMERAVALHATHQACELLRPRRLLVVLDRLAELVVEVERGSGARISSRWREIIRGRCRFLSGHRCSTRYTRGPCLCVAFVSVAPVVHVGGVHTAVYCLPEQACTGTPVAMRL